MRLTKPYYDGKERKAYQIEASPAKEVDRGKRQASPSRAILGKFPKISVFFEEC